MDGRRLAVALKDGSNRPEVLVPKVRVELTRGYPHR